MTATNHTEHYNLSQFVDTDRPTFTGDYNGDMSKIDAAIYAASQSGGTSGLTEVEHTADLTGDGTADSPLGVADTIARADDIPSLDGYATTESVTQAIAAAIADRLTAGDIKPGNGINIETSGNQVTISYVGGGSAGGLTAVTRDDTLTGDGTSDSPLGVNKFAPIDNIFDFDDATIFGMYFKPWGKAISNGPYDGTDNQYLVWVNSTSPAPLGDVIQLVIPIGDVNAREFWCRFYSNYAKWGQWERFAFMSDIPDVSALTSRIDTLEQQVAALTAAATPSATGLTATQLDTQYSDDYNIVRVGTPARNTESEVTSHE